MTKQRQQVTTSHSIDEQRRRVVRLSGGISLIAVAVLLGTGPAHAVPLAALDNLSIDVATGFVTNGTLPQSNTGTILATLSDETAASTSTQNGVGALPSTASVTGNSIAAYATGDGETNTTDFAGIGISDTANGIASLAAQVNESGEDTLDINSEVGTSSLTNLVSDAVDNDVLTLSDNLVSAQSAGNAAVSTVSGIVPVNYTDAGVSGGVGGGEAIGNVVVGTTQINTGVGFGSLLNTNDVSLLVDTNSSEGEDTQDLSISTAENSNTLSSTVTENSAENDISTALTTTADGTGAPTLSGSLVVANQQQNVGDSTNQPDVINFGGFTATNIDSTVATNVEQGTGGPSLLLDAGATAENDNAITSSATGNSAVGTTSAAAGNLITLGVNLNGDTPVETNTTDLIGGSGETFGDLALSNLQDNVTGSAIGAETIEGGIFADVQGATDSTIGLAGNTVSSSATANAANNAIQTAPSAEIDTISGITALTNVQSSAFVGEDGSAEAVTALTDIEANVGTLGEDFEPLGAIGSSIIVSDNSVSSAASGNQATNDIALSASTISDGVSGVAGGPANLTYTADDLGSTTDTADVSLNNVQVDAGSAASLFENLIAATAGGDALISDSVTIDGDALSATSSNNNATNTISLNGSQSVGGSAGLANAQLAAGSSASGEDNEVSLTFAGGGDASLSADTGLVSGTQISAAALGNEASNTLSAAGGEIADGAGGEDALSQSGGVLSDLALGNVQISEDVGTEATNNAVGVGIFADAGEDGGVSDSSFTLSGPAAAPTLQALAFGNEATNDASAVAGTGLQDSAGSLSVQINDAGTEATLTDSAVGAEVNNNVDASGDVSDTTVTVGSGATGGSNGNIVRALAYNNQASNTLTADAGTIDLINGDTAGSSTPFTALGNATVNDAYALANYQESNADAAATVADSVVGAYAGTGDAALVDSAVNTTGNAQVGSVFGNQAANSASIDAANISAGEDYVAAGDATNIQSTSGDATIEASLSGSTAGLVFTTQSGGTGLVSGSDLGVSHNTALTQAEGNAASTSLNVTSTDLADVATGEDGLTGLTVDTTGNAAADLAFTVQNFQAGSSTVSATQSLDNVLLSLAGGVSTSALSADSNTLEATAFNNNATNSLSFGDAPIDSLDASGGVENVQLSNATVNVTLGAPGTAATPGTSAVDIGQVPYTVAAGNSSATVTGTTLTVSGSPLVFSTADLSPTELIFFENLIPGGTYNAGANTYTLVAGPYNLSQAGVLNTGTLYTTTGSPISDQSTNDLNIPATEGTAATPASPSVLITVAGNIAGSTLTANNNAFDATAVANNAVNTNTVAATTLLGGADITAGTATSNVTGTVTTALADYATSNVQQLNAGVSASANGEVAINPVTAATDTQSITDSTLSASDNTALASAEGNVASNTLSLAATTTSGTDEVSPTGALVSNQTAAGDGATASSGSVGDTPTVGQIITAPSAITNSSLTLDGNTTTVQAIVNDVKNLVDVAATDLTTTFSDTTTEANAGTTSADADYSEANLQSATGSAAVATASTEVINADSTSTTTGGLVDSTADLSGNGTTAIAEANTAGNELELSGTNVDATGALVNSQTSSDSVTANGVSAVEFGLTGDANNAALSDSTVTETGNTLLSQAAANNAINLLSASATNLTTAGGVVNGVATGATATANYAVANDQTTDAGDGIVISATATNDVALNAIGATGEDGLTESTADLSGNAATANAYANIASNTLNLTAANSTVTGAVTNDQTNGDEVEATGLTTVAATANGATEAVDASTVNVSNNALNVQAVGDQATNALNAATGATYGSQLGASGSPVEATATYAVLNEQSNNAAVTATGTTGSQYEAVLNTAASTGPVTNATVTVSYNTVGVAAYGNSASNAVTAPALNSGNATVALDNVQTNAGAVTATDIGATIGASIGTPGFSASTIAVGHNSITASAVGNAATNVIAH